MKENYEMSETSDITVLVTGASGYVANHCVEQLLQAGYQVRGHHPFPVQRTQNAGDIQLR